LRGSSQSSEVLAGLLVGRRYHHYHSCENLLQGFLDLFFPILPLKVLLWMALFFDLSSLISAFSDIPSLQTHLSYLQYVSCSSQLPASCMLFLLPTPSSHQNHVLLVKEAFDLKKRQRHAHNPINSARFSLVPLCM